MRERPLYFRVDPTPAAVAHARVASERADLAAVLALAAELLELGESLRGAPGSLELKRDRLYPMLRALNGLGYRLQQCRSWPELAALLNAPLVRRKPEAPHPPR